MANGFARAYRHYSCPVERSGTFGSRRVLAPRARFTWDKEHVWHMDTIASVVDSDDGLLMKTPYQVVDRFQ